LSKTNNEFLDFALLLTDEVTDVIVSYYNNCSIKIKADGSELTEADQEAEKIIRARIEKKYPMHNILGEEFGKKNTSHSEYKWVIDPIDGTIFFTLGMPTFGTLIALLKDDEPIVGVIHFPVTNETVYAAKGLGCWYKSNKNKAVRIHVNKLDKVSEAIISAAGVHSTDIWTKNDEVPYNLSNVIKNAGKFRFCADCLQHSLVCRGKLHAAIDTIMNPWDVAAIIPCVEEAGGVVTDLSGNRSDILNGGSLISSSSSILHEELLRLLAQ